MNSFKFIAVYSLSVLMLGFMLLSLTWLPQVYHSLILFFSVSLPNIVAVLAAPKCLFVLSNLIVLFLFGESKFSKCTMKNDCTTQNEKVEYFEAQRKLLLYENSKETYVEMIQENKELVLATVEEKDIVETVATRDEMEAQDNGEEVEKECEFEEKREEEEKTQSEHEALDTQKEELEIKEDEEELESECEVLVREEEEIEVWPAEELNKKVEDFIAKVNMQFRLEARMAISCY